MNIAILGFGKVGKVLFDTMRNDPRFKEQFCVRYLWNRSYEAFEKADIPSEVTICREIKDLMPHLPEIDLVIECAHPSVLHAHALDILKHTHLFVSSPTAFRKASFYQEVIQQLEQSGHQCYIPLGASIGVWDIIRLDQGSQIKSLQVEMKKHPESFKVSEVGARKRLKKAMDAAGEIVVASGSVAEINQLAPQNTNTMAIYALAASTLGFSGCEGRIVANRNLETHIVTCSVETHVGLKLRLERDNPASPGAVTGSATFGSFLNSVYNYSKGVSHGPFVFC